MNIRDTLYRSFRQHERILNVLLAKKRMGLFLEILATEIMVAFHAGVRYWHVVKL